MTRFFLFILLLTPIDSLFADEGMWEPSQLPNIEKDILIKEIDYYHTNPIARSSKVMNECRKISKNFLFNGIEKAS